MKYSSCILRKTRDFGDFSSSSDDEIYVSTKSTTRKKPTRLPEIKNSVGVLYPDTCLLQSFENEKLSSNYVNLKIEKIDCNVDRAIPCLQKSMTKIPHFYVCPNCGAIFWDGSHRDQTFESYSNLLR